ncbi:hypothetical protein A3G50_00475 [Candidatus Jorgensenbacteria bacterium RIFCSPLOWO2_12_FULL_42_11]|uniref:O-antigen ligase-related domain-containing protein n=1 Tax=Candidatus Jorgensenbacteria bacterium RIFCSPLOWO2_12_FULL_42_11 TaxID=1798473 RepID=A0A1F6C1C7_9BACT|nr:MAG: hypothetical protein A3G50_00475 [Candidatus Jorgensenbacteria bacterium RIFCSPLOWO2_12_FULL_42_11]
MGQSQFILKNIIKFLLFATALTPLIIAWSTIFPYIFGKVVFFRSVIEIALILFLIYLLFNWKLKIKNWKLLVRNPLFIFVVLFILSLIISAIFAVNPYRAFWGTIDRGEGLFGMFHYFALLVMGLFIFEKKDWFNFFKIHLAVGLILIFYAFLQHPFKIYNFPFALKFIDPRPGSFIGNPSFLAVHLFFLMMFAVVVFSEKTRHTDEKRINADKAIRINPLKSAFAVVRKIFWRCFSLLIIMLSMITIFLTGTRGAILGLGTGLIILLFYFSLKRKGWLRKLSVCFLIFIIGFGWVFWATRHQPVWQKIPGFDRLAKTAAFDANDNSTQTRIITWRLSWNAFKEKPWFGWGPDNYLVAYEKHYEPGYAIYGETWLDRAHNKIFDVLVMQGLFGLLSYLGIFASAFYLLFKKRIAGKHFIMAGLVAYFVQNLVLFDQLNSDIAFFVILGYLISTELRAESVNYAAKPLITNNFYKLSSLTIVIVAISFLGYSVYAFNYVPFVQAKAFRESPVLGNVFFMEEKLKEAMYPYNFAQYNIRSFGIDAFYLDQFFYNPNLMEKSQLKVISDLLIEGMDEIVKREPFDVRTLIREVEMLNGVTKNYPFKDEKETAPLFKKAEALMREAVKRAPNRQEVYYHLAFNLAGQKRYDEAIETARYAVSLNPKVVRARYHLFLMLALAGRNEEALKELAVVEELRPNYDGLMVGDINTAMLFYYNLGMTDKVTEFLIKSLDGRTLHKFRRRYYEQALGYFASQEDAKHFFLMADYLAKFDDLKDNMEVLIDLAKNGNWSIIHNLRKI